MVNNYNNGKVYKIESHLGDKVYYGSTTKKLLSQRMTKHRGDYKGWLKGKCHLVTSYYLFEEYGLENCKIILVESCPCETKDELKARESYYIRNFDCVNKYIPGRTNKEYRTDNKSKKAEHDRQYYEDNKSKISEQRKIKTTCECGSICRKAEKSRHERTIKHINFINSQ